MNRKALAVSAVALSIGSITTAATASAHSKSHHHRTATYELTITNHTAGQPLSPPFIAIHHRRTDLWSVGAPASAVVAGIAEDADNGPALELAGHLRGVRSAFTAAEAGGPAPIGPGASQTYMFDVNRASDRISLLTMLVNTNDAFTGLDTASLPHHVGQTKTWNKKAYDAGSEVNNEMAAYIPGPVGNNPFVRDPEGNVIRKHPGIVGGHDLDPVVHSVAGTVATITVKRIK